MALKRLVLTVLATVAGLVAPATALAADPPVAAFGFEETSGTTATDSSANHTNGAITGATRVSTGRFGRALSFNGTSDLVRITDAASLDLTTGMTLEAWIKPANIGGWRAVIVKERPSDLSYALYASAPGAASAQLTTPTRDYKMADG